MATITDIEALGYQVTPDRQLDGFATWSVEGFGVSGTYRDDDQAAIDSLADPAAHTERRFQHEHPDAHAARGELQRKGYDVVRPDPAVDVFDVKEGATVVEADKTPPELPPLAATLPPVA